MSTSQSAIAPPRSAVVDIVEQACRAPSVHNTQPWAWRIDGSTLELYADEHRLLPATDPLGRDLVISCGAALHHAQVAALGLGWQPSVTRLPLGPDWDLLARIELSATPRTPGHVAALRHLHERRTDRRRFTSWPVPDSRLRALTATAEQWGVVATPVTSVEQRWQVDALLDLAFAAQDRDPALADEQTGWLGLHRDDGVPAHVVPDRPPGEAGRASRFGEGWLEDADREIETTDGLVVLATVADDRAAWLRTGEALSALWLDATSTGLSVVPLSQPIEVAQTRSRLQREVLVSLAVPHVLLRIGWSSISRTTLPPVPRRPVVEVLRG